MGYARLLISGELIRQRFGFPDGTDIVGSLKHVGGVVDGEIEIVVSHADIPDAERPEGSDLPVARPSFRNGPDGRPVMLDWGVETR